MVYDVQRSGERAECPDSEVYLNLYICSPCPIPRTVHVIDTSQRIQDVCLKSGRTRRWRRRHREGCAIPSDAHAQQYFGITEEVHKRHSLRLVEGQAWNLFYRYAKDS